MRLACLSYNALGFSNKNAIECIVGVVEARANFKEHERMHREVRGAAKCFKFSSAYITQQCRRAKKILCASACDVKLELHAPKLLYDIHLMYGPEGNS